MLRRALIAGSNSRLLQRTASRLPWTRAVAMRFVAGETLDDAVAVARRLNSRGASVSLDALGEAVLEPRIAHAAAETYRETLTRMAAAGIEGSISVKLTQLGLDIDPRLCRDLVADVCAAAAALGSDVTLDMEDSSHTPATVDLVLALRGLGHGNVGCAVQSYLYRTPDDVAKLTAAGASLRLCKGAYAEPPEVAYQKKAEVDAAYARLTQTLLRGGVYPRIATHDKRLVRHAKNLARRYGREPREFEFQMLYGVGEALQRELVADGYRLRVYVPFGSEWYRYFMRRLAERPANLAFFVRAVAGRRT
ncbi:MAG: proline dehydrogenase family protein [Actinomycetota bacterium]|nr:proline dehydrogenase family protein [Actinomycetota bacterium]